jgi:exopolyphosphatase/pppGpp-phosphohydrolase
VKDDLFAMTRTERLAVNGLPDFRVDTIIPALMLIERILLHGITELRWSRYSLKEGAAARMLG